MDAWKTETRERVARIIKSVRVDISLIESAHDVLLHDLPITANQMKRIALRLKERMQELETL